MDAEQSQMPPPKVTDGTALAIIQYLESRNTPDLERSNTSLGDELEKILLAIEDPQI